ncbi:MAG: hypothetical protein JNM56_35245 [Planctomycetia bacterium]|nr:hypothetical protein [Planctomycetia bacterium]
MKKLCCLFAMLAFVAALTVSSIGCGDNKATTKTTTATTGATGASTETKTEPAK